MTAAVTLVIVAQSIGTQAAKAEEAPRQLTLPLPGGAATQLCRPIDDSSNLTDLKLTRSFADNFSEATLSTDFWETHYPGVDNWTDNRTLAGNSEKEIYVDRDFKNAGIDPFSIKDGVLTITANKTPEKHLQAFKNLPYTSGLITSRNSFYQTYGYFEISARLPRGHAYWPAFWMLKRKQDWPPEIDIFESGGDKPENIDMTTHWKKDGTGPHQSTHCSVKVPGADTGFHLYGVLWTKERIVYYIDRKPIGQFATPAGLDQPMYMLANLAVTQNANDKTPVPGHFDIDWIAAYKF
jgi:beta-glucanase (GH16 family)